MKPTAVCNVQVCNSSWMDTTAFYNISSAVSHTAVSVWYSTREENNSSRRDRGQRNGLLFDLQQLDTFGVVGNDNFLCGNLYRGEKKREEERRCTGKCEV